MEKNVEAVLVGLKSLLHSVYGVNHLYNFQAQRINSGRPHPFHNACMFIALFLVLSWELVRKGKLVMGKLSFIAFGH